MESDEDLSGGRSGSRGRGGGDGLKTSALVCKKIQRFWRKMRFNRTTRVLAERVIQHGPTIRQVNEIT
jgi:hypothetical protein